jgi:hypothetical protein
MQSVARKWGASVARFQAPLCVHPKDFGLKAAARGLRRVVELCGTDEPSATGETMITSSNSMFVKYFRRRRFALGVAIWPDPVSISLTRSQSAATIGRRIFPSAAARF